MSKPMISISAKSIKNKRWNIVGKALELLFEQCGLKAEVDVGEDESGRLDITVTNMDNSRWQDLEKMSLEAGQETD
jgi:hypothetical protein